MFPARQHQRSGQNLETLWRRQMDLFFLCLKFPKSGRYPHFPGCHVVVIAGVD